MHVRSTPIASASIVKDRARLKVPVQQSMVTSMNGFACASCTSEALLLASDIASQNSLDLDTDYAKLAEHYLEKLFIVHGTTLVAKAEELGIDRVKVQSKLWRLMCAQWVYSKTLR
eukprot:3609462-Amphidinium_carterae.1